MLVFRDYFDSRVFFGCEKWFVSWLVIKLSVPPYILTYMIRYGFFKDILEYRFVKTKFFVSLFNECRFMLTKCLKFCGKGSFLEGLMGWYIYDIPFHLSHNLKIPWQA